MGNNAHSGDAPPQAFDIRHHDDDTVLVGRLTTWLAQVLGAGSDPQVLVVGDGIANGMSSSTVLFDLNWHDHGTAHRAALVARVAPDPDAVAVFATYDLAGQYSTMATVATQSRVPVPRLHWIEPTGDVLGQPFFIMDRVEGQIPPDMLPYTFGDGWLHDAEERQRARLQNAMIDVLADLHDIERAPSHFPALAMGGAPDGYLTRHFGRTRAWYDWSVTQSGTRSTLIETALHQLEATLPDDQGDPVLSWGDARIGNVIFDDFEPVAVLDWEMADLGPRELDVVWLCYSHRVFQDLAAGFDLAGLPDFLSIDDVTCAYTDRTRHTIRDLDWHLAYAAVRWGCAFLRTGAREAHLSGTPLTKDGDSLLHNRPSLTALVDGTFTY